MNKIVFNIPKQLTFRKAKGIAHKLNIPFFDFVIILKRNKACRLGLPRGH